MERFEGMKLEINEWKTSTESQFMSLINDQASSLAKLSQELAKDAIMDGVNLALCG